MKIVRPRIEVIGRINGDEILKKIERIGRVCYKSEDKITEDSAVKFISAIIKNGHESVLEHCSLTVRFICDRGVSHEIVRHRLCSFSQESTRYCCYNGDIQFMTPYYLLDETSKTYAADFNMWKTAMQFSEDNYKNAIASGDEPQQARCFLPNSLKTDIVVTANLREWRHIFKLRCAANAHPDMKLLMRPLCNYLRCRIPAIFSDIDWVVEEGDIGTISGKARPYLVEQENGAIIHY